MITTDDVLVFAQCVIYFLNSLDNWQIYQTSLYTFSFLDIVCIADVVSTIVYTYVELHTP